MLLYEVDERKVSGGSFMTELPAGQFFCKMYGYLCQIQTTRDQVLCVLPNKTS